MTDFRERYKRAGFGREDLGVNRTLRSQRRNEARRNQRDEQLDSLRIDLVPDSLETISHQESSSNNLPPKHDKFYSMQTDSMQTDSTDSENVNRAEEGLQKRLLELEKWREEKKKKKINEKKKAKPVFKVGVVHHKVYSPPLNKSSTQTSAQKLCKTVKLSQPEAPVKRITRATEKRLAVKAVTSQQKRENMRIKKKQQVQSDYDKNNFFKMTPLAPKDHKFKAPAGITPMQMFGRQISKPKIDAELDFSFSDISSTKNNFPVQTSSINFLQSNDDISFNMSQPSEITFGMQKTSTRLFDYKSLDKALDSFKPNSKKSKTSKNDTSWKVVPEVDAEMHNNQENVDSNLESDSSVSTDLFTNRRRSLRKRVPLEERSNEAEKVDQKKLSPEQNLQVSKYDSTLGITQDEHSNLKGKEKRKSTRLSNLLMATEEKQLINSESDSNLTTREHCLSIENELNSSSKRRLNVKKNNSVNSMLDVGTRTPLRKSNKRKSEAMDTKESIEDSDDFILQLDETYCKKPRLSSIKKTPNEKSVPKKLERKLEKQSSGSKRHSTGKAVNELLLPDIQQESTKTQHTVTLDNVPNLMDFTFSEPPRGFRRPTVFPSELQNQSLIKFSPRSSQIHKPMNKTIDLSENEIKNVNTSTSSEPSESIPLEKTNNLQSLSFNLSLPHENDTPTVYSPYVVTTRGKNNIRKELKKRMSHQFNSSDIPTKDTVMQNLNISALDEERTTQYYEFILDRETERLNQLCNTWNKIKETPGIPEDIKYQIQADVGQTQLLLNKKFKRFRSLVEDCKLRKEGMLVTSKDLQGFWEMSCAEVRQCDNRFDRLEKLKEKNWEEDQDDVEQQKKVVRKKTVIKKAPVKKKINAKSSIRAHIMAVRKKLENTDNNEDPKLIENNDKTCMLKSEVLKSPKSARRSISTPVSVDRRRSQLKKVQSSQEKKKTSSPLVQMKISQMCKTPEVRLDGSIIYINSNRTPAKGILKSINNDANKSIKQSNKVLFKEQPMEVDEFKKKDFGHPEPLERQLNFEDDSFESLHIEDKKELTEVSHTQKALNDSNKNIKVTVSPASPVISMSPLNLNESKLTRKSRKQITFKFSTSEENSSTRMTRRSNKLSVPLTPKSIKDKSKVDDSLMEANDNSYCDSPMLNKKELLINEKGFVTRSTPRLMKLRLNNSEESSPDTTVTEEYSPNAKTNKLLKRRTPTSKKSSSALNLEKEKLSSGSKLKRTKSMVTKYINDSNTSEELITPKLKRSSSLRQKKSSPSDSAEKVNTPSLNRRHSKRLHHQISLNEKKD